MVDKQEIADFLSGGKAKAKSVVRLMTPAQMATLSSVIEEVIEENAVKVEKAKDIQRQLEEFNMTLDDVAQLSSAGSPKKSARVVPIKYRGEFDGQVVEWSGRGRTPKAFADVIEAGKNLDDYLV